MQLPRRRARISCAVPFLFLLTAPGLAADQKKISCPDGERFEIDVKQIAIQYDASSFAGTLSSLSALGARFEVAPKKLQEAAAATQQWDELLKGLVAGYNSCAVTREQYAEGLRRIYPRLKEDAASLEEIRKVVSEGRKTDEKRLANLITKYYEELRQFAHVSGGDIILERVEALAEQVAAGQREILERQKTDTQKIMERFDQLQQRESERPVPTPEIVRNEISEIRKNLLAKADEAEIAYNQGYSLLNRFRFREAIPYLQQAIGAVPLPFFFTVLGHAYLELPDLDRAEETTRKGLSLVAGKGDTNESQLAGQLAIVLARRGDLAGAQSYAEKALNIDERIHGRDDPNVVANLNILGQVLLDRGDLKGALSRTEEALRISEKAYGPEDAMVATLANNTGQILKERGDWDGALKYTEQALKIAEKVYGPDHPTVAIYANNIGTILEDKDDFDGALGYLQRALMIDERAYGPDHPEVATDCDNIAYALKAKGNLSEALRYAERARAIDERVYGLNHPRVATDYDNVGTILLEKGDLDKALQYTRRALEIDERIYGSDHLKVAKPASNIGMTLKAKGDLDGALSYVERALRIDERVYGPDHLEVATDYSNMAEIFWAKRDLDDTLSYERRALRIYEGVYGPKDPRVAESALKIGIALREKGNLDEAITSTERALTILMEFNGPESPSSKKVAATLAQMKEAKRRKLVDTEKKE